MENKYYLITYYQESCVERDDWGEPRKYEERIKTCTTRDWVDFVNIEGVKRILFLKELTEEEYKSIWL